MRVSAQSINSTPRVEIKWLNNRDWDLKFISLSVVLVPIPYLVYLLLMSMQPIMSPIADFLGTSVDDLSRNAVNGMVALVIGGPHMYATFSRTALDGDFARSHSRLLWSSLLIPMIVVGLALANLPLLLTIFFFWASIHVLHQIVFITELYNHKSKSSLSLFSRLADYAVILTSLYPLAFYKMVEGDFTIGHHDIGAQVESMLQVFGLSLGMWLVVLMGGTFAIALAVWMFSNYLSYQNGTLHLPKTLFIGLTVGASFFVPALGNLDTAFQGMNFWHSLQYLALTWMINNLRHNRGELQHAPFLEGMSKDNTQQKFYWFNVSMMLANMILGVAVFATLYVIAGKPFDFAFDRSYYIAVLSILWIHYYQDHYLFTEPQVIMK
jgi:hypothetical protein